jgi:hypothetical protein
MYVFLLGTTFSNVHVDKLEAARYAARSPLGVAVLNQPEIKTTRGRLYNTVSKLRHRLRSLSPQKISSRMEGKDQEQSASIRED